MHERMQSGRPPVIAWQGYYSVGNDYLDEQHQSIISLVNWLYEAITSGKEQDALPTLTRRLVEYTRVHFEDEEQMMLRNKYPALAEHKRAHERLVEQTRDLHFRTLQENPPGGQEVLTFLKQWWINHITGQDKTYVPYLQKDDQRHDGIAPNDPAAPSENGALS